jgi:hypothetical protein
MDDAAVKESRRILRQVQSHLTESRLQEGVVREQAGLVDVFHHPKYTQPDLNYISPRKNTAWISAKDVQIGLDTLKGHDRAPRIEYLDGLFPERFGESLETMGLMFERSAPLLIYTVDDSPFKVPSALDGVHIDAVSDAQGSALWWYVWRNTYYEVVTNTADPVFIGHDLWKINAGKQIDLVMYRYRFPVGVARVSVQDQTAQIVAVTILKEIRTDASLWLLQASAAQAAIKQGCTLIFTSGVSEEDRRLYRDHRFVDCGNVLCYSDKQKTCKDNETNDTVAQSILTHTS